MNKIVTCPNCSNVTILDSSNLFRPFCSERCRLIDLGNWIEEKYNIAGTAAPGLQQDQHETH
jgi:uncharacterized protein